MVIIRCWYCEWLSLYSIFYSYLRRVMSKLLCFTIVSKTFKFLLMAGSSSQTQKVDTFQLMGEPPGLHPLVLTNPRSAPLGVSRGMSVGPGKVMGCHQPQQDWEERYNHSQDHGLLDAGNTVKVTYPSCSQQVPGTILDDWVCGWSFIFFLIFFNDMFL